VVRDSFGVPVHPPCARHAVVLLAAVNNRFAPSVTDTT
jgi:hypothetical protein